VISNLTEGVGNRNCPVCDLQIDYGERLIGKGFGEAVDVIDIETGEPLLNPDKRDNHDKPMPFRISNKEFSTQVVEQKMQRLQLKVANDEGAGESRLGMAHLLTNHRVVGHTKKERIFHGKDDDSIDARRQAALGILERKFGGSRMVNPEMSLVASAGHREAGMLFGIPGGVNVTRGLQDFASGSVMKGFR
jgi:hypothetical protein